MSGINDIIAYGFGGWSTVAKVPTLGFGIGAVADVIFIGSIGMCMSSRKPETTTSGVTARATVSARKPETTATAEGMGCDSD